MAGEMLYIDGVETGGDLAADQPDLERDQGISAQ